MKVKYKFLGTKNMTSSFRTIEVVSTVCFHLEIVEGKGRVSWGRGKVSRGMVVGEKGRVSRGGVVGGNGRVSWGGVVGERAE